MKEKDKMIRSIDAEKAFEKIQHHYDKKKNTLSKVGIEATYHNVIKTVYDRPIANIILISKNVKVFFLNQEQSKDIHFNHFYLT